LRKTHGAAGTFDLPLNTWPGDLTTEPRAPDSGGAQVLVFTFDKPLTSSTAWVTPNAFAGAPTYNGNEVTIAIAPISDASYVSAAVQDGMSADGGVGGFGAVRIGFLVGDATVDGGVTLSDVLNVNASLTQPVTAATYLGDVNRDGTLSLSDLLFINARLTRVLPAACVRNDDDLLALWFSIADARNNVTATWSSFLPNAVPASRLKG
jgi:hypothetical protein